MPEASIERLKAIGRWMKLNGEAIYGTQASPFKRLAWGRCTKKLTGNGVTLYLHVFDWPSDSKLIVPGLRNPVQKAYLLSDKHHSIRAENGPEGITLTVPSAAPDAVSSTIVLKVNGALEIEQPVLSQQPDGTILLPASEARIHGEQLRYESGSQRDNLGFWFDPAESAEWEFTVSKPGRFEVAAEVAAPETASLELSSKGQKLKEPIAATGDYSKFQWTKLGLLEIKTTLSVRGVADGWHPINVKSIRLMPTGR